MQRGFILLCVFYFKKFLGVGRENKMFFVKVGYKEERILANEQNLTHQLTNEDRSKGGKESGKTRRLKAAVESALDSLVVSDDFNDLFEQFGVEKSETNFAKAIGYAFVLKAAKGDLSAATLIRDTIGEKPKEEIDLNGGVVIIDDISDSVK